MGYSGVGMDFLKKYWEELFLIVVVSIIIGVFVLIFTTETPMRNACKDAGGYALMSYNSKVVLCMKEYNRKVLKRKVKYE